VTQGRAEEEAERLRSYLKEMLRASRVATITAGELVLEDAAQRSISASVFARAR